ncbi:MAG: putative quinol monooxygenase [Pseudomonadota bacterium]
MTPGLLAADSGGADITAQASEAQVAAPQIADAPTGPEIVVLGRFRVAPNRVRTLNNHARAMLHASQDEEGCLDYAFAEDIDEPGLIRIEARWASRDALERHLRTPHAIAWRIAQAEIGVMGHVVETFPVESGTARPERGE